MYEIETRKREMDIDRPFRVGQAVHQMAKLRILQLYYDCLEMFLDRRDFELVQMDTDSLYFALSYDSLENMEKKDGSLGTNGVCANLGCSSWSSKVLARLLCVTNVVTARAITRTER